LAGRFAAGSPRGCFQSSQVGCELKTKRGIKLHGRPPLCCCHPDPARRLRNTRAGSPPRAGPVLSQHGVVKGGGTSDVRDADAGVVDHRNLLGQSPRTRSARRTRTEDRAASGRRSAPMRLLLLMPPPPNTATCEAGIMPWFGPCSQFRGRPSYGRRTALLPRLAPIMRCTVVGEVSWGRCTSWRSAMPPIQPSAWKGFSRKFP
jgi:hypothetical protein